MIQFVCQSATENMPNAVIHAPVTPSVLMAAHVIT